MVTVKVFLHGVKGAVLNGYAESRYERQTGGTAVMALELLGEDGGAIYIFGLEPGPALALLDHLRAQVLAVREAEAKARDQQMLGGPTYRKPECAMAQAMDVCLGAG
jgi:hypothetical protein